MQARFLTHLTRLTRLTRLTLVIAGILSAQMCSRGVSEALSDPLTDLRGQPAVIDFPDLDGFGEELPVPEEWGYLQVGAENLAVLQRQLGVTRVPAVVYVDRHGNVMFRDESESCRRQVRPAIQQYDRQQKQIQQRIERWWREARKAREGQRFAREVDRIARILAQSVSGYPEVIAAQERGAEIQRDRQRRLLEITAGEGIVPRARLRAQLKELARISAGLPVARKIQRQRKRFDKGVMVERTERS